MECIASRVCQLCQQKLPDNEYKNQSTSINDLANVLFLKWDKSSVNNIICNTCIAKMEEFCEFKFKCLITEEKIKKFKVLERRHSGDKADRYICRFCKEDITEMSIKPLMEWLKDGLQEIVEAHFPEIDIYAVKDSFICKPCSQNIYNFGQFTAAWSNNNFNGDWVNGLVKKEHNPVEKCNTEKDEESSNTKLNTGAMIDTEGNARRKPIETPNKICKSQMPQPFQEDCLKKEPVDRNSTEGLVFLSI
ncbi:unnamed protein product [Acanthoscelides obtectus]|uniref:ZAD domain-containing protein n=1 Tax=Acanthoscelides obtectus TaxID=200917 RepID=A0A9P0KQ13_ACAOB|nr:unnamed protein product [Acanthoscelides obtectus]CAK1675566.1 hypothetical protein AOBTE_LOCUS30303 [Acanthoscelides obtectus]